MNFGGRSTAPSASLDDMGEEAVPAPPGDQRRDHDLLAAHLAGDARAFAALIARYEQRLWWTAKRHSRTESDAADALQEALVKALRGASAFRRDATVSTWLHRIVVNSCHDRMRGRHGPPDGVVDERATPGMAEVRVADPALTVVMRQAMDRLPAEQREVIIDVDLMGWPVADVARRLGVPEGTVKSRRSRARAALRRQLDQLETEVAR
ncbi:RNA polymerase sigma factor SigM [uncultured Corynebacterium sp.]|uniref:RNA polymerase sigma factor SigM n=1 Tax=uncultured Corynebacterium sp. TaxID=159447 RepID=UPI0025F1129A|nr:RNA polymerase sigma factor SigM [uncultured Corynebacterium sp.]